MRIEIMRPTRVNGEPVDVGDEIDTDKKTAEYLVSIGKATPATKPAKPKKDTK